MLKQSSDTNCDDPPFPTVETIENGDSHLGFIKEPTHKISYTNEIQSLTAEIKFKKIIAVHEAANIIYIRVI